MSNLHLTLNKKWFSRHLKDKNEDYREIKPYWITRLFDFRHDIYPDGVLSVHMDEIICDMRDLTRFHSIEELYHHHDIAPRKFDGVMFSNGYSKNRPRMKKEFLDITIGQGRKEWGAPVNEMVIIIRTGNIIWNTHIEEDICRSL